MWRLCWGGDVSLCEMVGFCDVKQQTCGRIGIVRASCVSQSIRCLVAHHMGQANVLLHTFALLICARAAAVLSAVQYSAVISVALPPSITHKPPSPYLPSLTLSSVSPSSSSRPCFIFFLIWSLKRLRLLFGLSRVMSETQNNVGLAFGVVTAAGLSTTLGAALAFVMPYSRSTKNLFLAACLSIAAGVMLYVSFVEIFVDKAISEFEEALPNHDKYVFIFNFFISIYSALSNIPLLILYCVFCAIAWRICMQPFASSAVFSLPGSLINSCIFSSTSSESARLIESKRVISVLHCQLPWSKPALLLMRKAATPTPDRLTNHCNSRTRMMVRWWQIYMRKLTTNERLFAWAFLLVWHWLFMYVA